jgi:hypothetical protein
VPKPERLLSDNDDAELLECGKKRAKELGLVMNTTTLPFSWYKAFAIHRLLGEGIPLTAHKSDDPSGWNIGNFSDRRDSHIALGIGLRPIKEESEERKFIRELVKRWYADQGGLRGMDDLYARAQDLLIDSHE